MTAVRFDASIRYALWIVAYLAAVTILGAGAVVLGLGLGWPTVLGWSWLAATLGSSTGGLAYSVGGGFLIVVGVLIAAIGYISGVYKLVADAIAAGTVELERLITELEIPDVPEEAPTAASDEPAEPAAVEAVSEQLDAAGGDTDGATTQPGPKADAADVEPSGSSGPDLGPPESPTPETEAEAPGSPPESDEEPPEPSPEEIAFGSSDPTDEPVDDELVEEESGDEDVSPAARSAPSDPLADPTDE